MLKNIVVLVAVPTLLFCSCKDSEQADSGAVGGKKMEIQVTSSAFEEGGLIPPEYTCDGTDISPPLQWDAVPEGTKSIALISDDPDAPMGTWVHWVIFGLPADTRLYPTEPNKGPATLAKSAMAAHARPAAHTDTSLRFTRSIQKLICPPVPKNVNCSRLWKGTSSARDN